jgi:hypothetical protein
VVKNLEGVTADTKWAEVREAMDEKMDGDAKYDTLDAKDKQVEYTIHSYTAGRVHCTLHTMHCR